MTGLEHSLGEMTLPLTPEAAQVGKVKRMKRISAAFILYLSAYFTKPLRATFLTRLVRDNL
jgi:hypothetical protein